MEQKDDTLFIKLIPYIDKYGILLLIAIMLLVLHLLQPDVFFSWRNITNIFEQISWQSMLALGVFMVIVTAGIDLSVGSILMLSLMALAIASSSDCKPALGYAEPVLPARISAPIPDKKPHKVYTRTKILLTLIPAARAASGLPPIA